MKDLSFIGDYSCKADTKGRIAIPSAFRKQLSDNGEVSLVVRKDIFEPCLVLYTKQEWERQVELVRNKVNEYNHQHQRLLREFFRGSAEVLPDNNGRILIPKRLTDLAGIEKEVIMVGIDRRIEIWDKTTYERIALDSGDFADLAQDILGSNKLEMFQN